MWAARRGISVNSPTELRMWTCNPRAAFSYAPGAMPRVSRARMSAASSPSAQPGLKPLTKTELRRLSVVTLRAELESRNLSAQGAGILVTDDPRFPASTACSPERAWACILASIRTHMLHTFPHPSPLPRKRPVTLTFRRIVFCNRREEGRPRRPAHGGPRGDARVSGRCQPHRAASRRSPRR